MPLKQLEKKLRSKTLKIGIIGQGYVGLPLAMAFAESGFSVTGIDIDRRKADRLNKGESHILDVSSVRLRRALRRKRYRATDDYKALAALDAVIICVPTPLSKTRQPDISFIIDATEKIARYLKKGQLVVLESTTYPGTTEEVMRPILEKKGLEAEKDFFLAFSPERVDPGNKQFDTASIPKVVGGVGPLSTKAAELVYGAVIRRLVPVSSASAAEMVKLLENTFRSVNIGLINEIALMSHKLGIDIWEVVDAAKTKPFGFMPFYPGPGIGGHCLPIDPLYLSWKSRLHGFEAKMIELASSINEAMPDYVVERIRQLLNSHRLPLKGTPVLVLGVSYKRDIDDLRESPAIAVMLNLLKEGAVVRYADPHVSSVDLVDFKLKADKLTPALLKKQRCTVILTEHSAFDYGMVVKHSEMILDTRNVLRRFKGDRRIFFL